MAKFYGNIGFANTIETSPGIWEDQIVERQYVGDVIRNQRNWRSDEKVNPDLTISESISIIADSHTLANAHTMKYVQWRGAYWTINSLRVERPRIVLEIGGLYNGLTAGTA